LALVLLIFYWAFDGAVLVVCGYVLSLYGVIGSGIGSAIRELRDVPQMQWIAAAMGLVEFAGILEFCYGFLLLAACYGLWTFQQWGVLLGRRLAIVGAAWSVIFLILALCARAGIVLGIFGLVISVAILVYLHVDTSLVTLLRQQWRPKAPGEDAGKV